MLVVPDNATANKVLSVPGMIVYREDKKKLYVAKDKKLNALAEEKKVPVSPCSNIYSTQIQPVNGSFLVTNTKCQIVVLLDSFCFSYLKADVPFCNGYLYFCATFNCT